MGKGKDKSGLADRALAGFVEAMRDGRLDDAVAAVVKAIREGVLAAVGTDLIRPGDLYDPAAEYRSVTGAAAVFDVDAETVRRAVRECRAGYAIVVDGRGYLDKDGMNAVRGWLAEHGLAEPEKE